MPDWDIRAAKMVLGIVTRRAGFCWGWRSGDGMGMGMDGDGEGWGGRWRCTARQVLLAVGDTLPGCVLNRAVGKERRERGGSKEEKLVSLGLFKAVIYGNSEVMSESLCGVGFGPCAVPHSGDYIWVGDDIMFGSGAAGESAARLFSMRNTPVINHLYEHTTSCDGWYKAEALPLPAPDLRLHSSTSQHGVDVFSSTFPYVYSGMPIQSGLSPGLMDYPWMRTTRPESGFSIVPLPAFCGVDFGNGDRP